MAHPHRENPFNPNAPIDPRYFAGRKSEIEIVVQALTQTRSGSQQNILVTGERGIGKSSLAHLARYIAEEPRQEWGTECKFVTAYYTLFDNDGVSDCCRGLVEKLRERVGASLGKRLVQKLKELDYSLTVDFWFAAAKVTTKGQGQGQGKNGPAELRRDFVRILETLWDELSREGCNGIMLMLDELHKIDLKDNLGAFFKKVSEDLVADGYRNIMFFVLGLPVIESNLAEDDASVVRIFEHVELDLMPETESEEVITKALENTGVKIEPQPVQELIDWSDGHPYFLQQLCFDCFAADDDDNLDMDDFFNGSIASLKQFGRKFWGKDIRDLDGDSQKIVRVLAKDKSKEVVPYSELKDQTKAKKLGACLAGLEKKGLVKSLGNKRYKLSSRALMLYISRTQKQERWLERAEEESKMEDASSKEAC